MTQNPAAHRPDDRGELAPVREQLVAQIARCLLEEATPAANEALERRDDDPCVRGCGHYASRRIDTATLDDLRSADALPPESRSRQLAVRAAVPRLEQQLGRAPRAWEVADELGWTLAALHRCMVEAGAGGLRAGDVPLEDGVATPPPASEQAGAPPTRQLLAVLSQAFEKLAEREQFVMEMVYSRGLRFNEVGFTLGVAGSHAERIHDGAIARLLESLGALVQRVRPEA